MLVRGDPDRALDIAAALEARSEHPLARAFERDARPIGVATDIRVVAGSGIEGDVGGRRYRLGTGSYAAALSGTPAGARNGGGEVPEEAIVLADASGPIAAFGVHDEFAPGRCTHRRGASRDGFDVEIASGDAPGGWPRSPRPAASSGRRRGLSRRQNGALARVELGGSFGGDDRRWHQRRARPGRRRACPLPWREAPRSRSPAPM